jgi:hypothetical protein
MTEATSGITRYFLTYSSRTLPLQLVEELPVEALRNRNTWFEAVYDPSGRMLSVCKLVYGDVEMRHDYEYAEDGRLASALIQMADEEPHRLQLLG